MANTRRLLWGIVIMAVIIFCSVSCDTDEEAGGKPWDGQEVKKLAKGSGIMSNSPSTSGIPNAKAGNSYWYYIDAKRGMTYKISMWTLALPPWMKNDKNLAPNLAPATMTGYKEDGTVFGIMNPQNKGNNLDTPITFYSILDQKLYIKFTFLANGYLTFYYQEEY